jgi:hypothetical protein
MAWMQKCEFPQFEWFGSFAKALPDYALFHGAKFAGDGKYPGNPKLKLVVRDCTNTDYASCNGVVWSPPNELMNCAVTLRLLPDDETLFGIRGYAVPYSESDTFVQSIFAATEKNKCRLFQVCGGIPFILILIDDVHGYQPEYDALLDFCQGLGRICLANYIVSIQKLAFDAGDTMNPVIYREFDHGPNYYTGWIPGRYVSGLTDTDTTRASIRDLARASMAKPGEKRRGDTWGGVAAKPGAHAGSAPRRDAGKHAKASGGHGYAPDAMVLSH